MHSSDVTAHVLAMAEAGTLIRMCAWCGRFLIDGEWAQPPRGSLTTIDVPNAVSHSICPTCAAKHSETR